MDPKIADPEKASTDADPESATTLDDVADIATTADALLEVTSAAAYLGKGALGAIRKKLHYKKNLKNNYDMLERELEKLIALADDIESGSIAKEQVRNLSTYKVWEKRVWSIQEEVKALLPKYETTKFHKARLSKEFVNKRAEVIHHINEGYNLIKQFSPN